MSVLAWPGFRSWRCCPLFCRFCGSRLLVRQGGRIVLVLDRCAMVFIVVYLGRDTLRSSGLLRVLTFTSTMLLDSQSVPEAAHLTMETYPSTLEATLLGAGSHRVTDEFLIVIVLLRLELLLLYPKASLMTAEGDDDDAGRVQCCVGAASM